MTDWAKLTTGLEHALTLDEAGAAAFLDTRFTDEPTRELAQHLLARSRKSRGFMMTSAPGTPTEEIVQDADGLSEGTRIGVWELQELIGRGGMGEVYRARRADGLYDQVVALKLIHGHSELRAARFEQERRRLALMAHPGIARILDGGTAPDGRAFMAMDLVDGQPIDRHAERAALDRSTRIRLFAELCSAVSHAHSRLILHRDIKPENVLVDDSGKVRLIDFGIASSLEGEEEIRAPLTLSSAAPEQLKGEPVSVQTDVFALGVLLHQLLAGARPSRTSDGGMETDASAIGNADPVAIVAHCLETEPASRYASVDSLRDDLDAYLERRAISLRRDDPVYRMGRFLTRFPVASTLGAIAVLALAGGLVASLNFAAAARTEADRANRALAESQANLERSDFYLSRADLFHSTQSAYADTLQSLFGGEADVARQTQVLRQRWQQAHDLRDEDPENAAYLSYAIGRQFLFRNDYLTAIEILRPWVEESYGPPDLVGYGRQLLAVAYMSVGRDEEALPILRDTEDWFASSYDAGMPDHIAAATQIALITQSEADILKAENLLLAGLELDQNSSIEMYFWNQLSRMRQMRGDFPAAYDAMLQVVAIIESTPLMDVSGTDTGRLNLADFEIWHTGDIDRAETLALEVLNTAQQTKGESRELGLAHGVLALVQVERGALDAARTEIETAIEITSRYSGDTASSVLVLRLQRAEILAAMDDAGALTALDGVRADLQHAPNSQTLIERLKLADLYVTALLQGPEHALSRYHVLELDRDLISRNLQLDYLHRRLESIGAASASLVD